MKPAFSYRKTKAFLAVCFICLMLSLLPRQTLAAPLVTQPARILFIPAYNFEYLGVKWFMQGVMSEFADRIPQRVLFSIENLQLTANPGNTIYLETIAKSLQIKYASEKPDLIIAEYKPAVQFLQRYGRQIFGDVPVVFAGLEIEGFGNMTLPANFTGITTSFNAKHNIDLIIKNHPKVKKLYIVAGAGAPDIEMLANSMLQAPQYQDKLELIPFRQAPYEETLRNIAQLQTGSAIMYLAMQLDVNGQTLVPAEVAKDIAEVARVPVYGMLDTYSGSGITGGYLINHDKLGRRAAEIAASILLGKQPWEIPPSNEAIGAYTFDWRQLQRWGVDETGLPPGSVVEFRTFSVWEAYKLEISVGILLLILQGALVIFLFVNLSRRKRAEAALASSVSQLRTLVKTIPDLVWLKNTEGVYMACNSVFERLIGATEAEIIGKTTYDLFDKEQADFFGENDRRAMAAGKPSVNEEWLTFADDGRRILVEAIKTPMFNDDGAIIGVLGIARDISERVRREQAEFYQAAHDGLTGLYNRFGFADAVAKSLSAGQGGGALLLVGIDDFKLINDAHGLAVGDMYLAAFGRYLQINFGETALVARFGSDEFMLFFAGPEGLLEATRSSEKMEIICLEIGIGSFFVHLSGGISLIAEQENNLDLQIQHAYLALHYAKDSGKWCCRTYESALQDKVTRRYAIRDALNHALANEELRLVYQPIFDIQAASGKIVGYEALLRWNNPRLGAISPMEFIPVAEETNLILSIGKWVLHEACRFSVNIWKTYGEFVNVSINISMRQLSMPNFVSMVKETLLETGLPAGNLSLEVTESILMTDAALRISYLQELRDFGVSISLDDFGTGYSSFTYLAQMPITTLKIDKSMVDEITDGSHGKSLLLLEALLHLSRLLGYKMIAEGVETQEQLIFLQSKGCHYCQGFLLSRPLPEEAVLAMYEVSRDR